MRTPRLSFDPRMGVPRVGYSRPRPRLRPPGHASVRAFFPGPFFPGFLIPRFLVPGLLFPRPVVLGLLGLLIGLVVVPVPGLAQEPSLDATRREMASRSSPVLARASILERELTAMVERVRTGVVTIRSRREVPAGGGRESLCEGSGVVLEDGTVATTLSVAGPGADIEVTYYDGRRSSAEVLAVDPVRELVILETPVAAAGGLEPGSPDSLHAGSWVFILSFPLGAPEASLTSGRFSSRTILDLTGARADPVELLQLEASVFPGNSGGAVLDAWGRLVGLVVGGISRDGFLDPVVLSSFTGDAPGAASVMMAQPTLGVALALPASDVMALARAAAGTEVKQRAFVGIRVRTGGEDAGGGVGVLEVVGESPAQRSGVRVGDRVVGVDDQQVTDPASLASLLEGRTPGSTTTLVLEDPAGETRDAVLRLGDYTADYQMRFVWGRLLSGRTESLTTARERLLHQLQVIESELVRVGDRSVPAGSFAIGSER